MKTLPGHVLDAVDKFKRTSATKPMTEDYIDAMYYHKMYHLDACWKGSPRVISRELN
jgi:hypothetical protein